MQDGKHRYFALLKLQNSANTKTKDEWKDFKVPCVVVEQSSQSSQLHLSASKYFYNLIGLNEGAGFSFVPTLFDTITHYRRMHKLFKEENQIKTNWSERVILLINQVESQFRILQVYA